MESSTGSHGLADYVRDRGQALAGLALLLTGGDQAAADDLVQATMLRLARRWSRLHDGNRDAYARQVMAGIHCSWWRRRSSSEVVTDRLPDRTVPDHAERVASRTALFAALRTLPARQRAAVVLRVYEDRSETDTAALLGCSVGTVKSQTARGLARLRVLLPDPLGDVPIEPEVRP